MWLSPEIIFVKALRLYYYCWTTIKAHYLVAAVARGVCVTTFICTFVLPKKKKKTCYNPPPTPKAPFFFHLLCIELNSERHDIRFTAAHRHYIYNIRYSYELCVQLSYPQIRAQTSSLLSSYTFSFIFLLSTQG